MQVFYVSIFMYKILSGAIEILLNVFIYILITSCNLYT